MLAPVPVFVNRVLSADIGLNMRVKTYHLRQPLALELAIVTAMYIVYFSQIYCFLSDEARTFHGAMERRAGILFGKFWIAGRICATCQCV